MGADAPTQTGRFEDALLPHSFGVPFRKRSVTEARHFRNKLNGLCLSTQPYLQIYKIPKIPLRIKKIDCLTTTNLVNLKSNTMKNTLQRYAVLEFYAKLLQQKRFALIIFNNKGFNYGTPNRIRHNKNNSAYTHRIQHQVRRAAPKRDNRLALRKNSI